MFGMGTGGTLSLRSPEDLAGVFASLRIAGSSSPKRELWMKSGLIVIDGQHFQIAPKTYS